VLHELETLHVTPGAVAKFKPVMAPFLELTESYEPLALRAAARTMIDCIYSEVSAACKAPKQPLEPLGRFFANLEEAAYLPRVYTTNYDDFIGQATNDRYFTGFTQSHGDHDDFDATAFWSHWDAPALFHVHGSIHMGFPRPDDKHEIGDIAWYAAREDALTLIAAPSSTKNGSGTRDAEMQSTQKGGNWYFGMKMHIGVDAESGLVHMVIGTAANVHDITVAQALLHGEETDVYADAGYQGIEKRCEADAVRWHVAMRPAKRRKLDLSDSLDAIYDQIERLKAGIRAKVEHPFRILKRQFGYMKTRYRGLMKNTAQIITLFALGNLWMAHRALRKA